MLKLFNYLLSLCLCVFCFCVRRFQPPNSSMNVEETTMPPYCWMIVEALHSVFVFFSPPFFVSKFSLQFCCPSISPIHRSPFFLSFSVSFSVFESLNLRCSLLYSRWLVHTCTGHASPYHYHADLACDYNKTADGHSALVGVALDGYGIYGLHETTGTKPTNLDGLIRRLECLRTEKKWWWKKCVMNGWWLFCIYPCGKCKGWGCTACTQFLSYVFHQLLHAKKSSSQIFSSSLFFSANTLLTEWPASLPAIAPKKISITNYCCTYHYAENSLHQIVRLVIYILIVLPPSICIYLSVCLCFHYLSIHPSILLSHR